MSGKRHAHNHMRVITSTKNNSLVHRLTFVLDYTERLDLPEGNSPGERLKRWRMINGVEQKEVAEILGKHRGTIQGWEKNLWNPPETVVGAIEELIEKAVI